MVDAAEAVSLGRQARNDGNFTMAREHYAEAAKTYRDQKDLLAYAHTIRHIADIFRQERNLTKAKPLYEESLELYRSNLDTKLLDLANTVRPYALLNEEQGNLDLARKLWEEARHLQPAIEVLHRNKHAIEFYNYTFTIAQGGGKKGHWIVFSSPALFHRD